MNKKIIIITLFICILVTTQAIALGIKAEGTFGANTTIADLGITFGETKNSYFTTGLSLGKSSGSYIKYYQDRYNHYTKTEYYYEPLLGVFFEYSYGLNFLNSNSFTLGAEVGFGARACYYYDAEEIGFDVYPRLDLIATYKNLALNLGYKFMYKYDTWDFYNNNCFSVGLKYNFGTKTDSTTTTVNNSIINTNNPKFVIIDSDLVTF